MVGHSRWPPLPTTAWLRVRGLGWGVLGGGLHWRLLE